MKVTMVDCQQDFSKAVAVKSNKTIAKLLCSLIRRSPLKGEPRKNELKMLIYSRANSAFSLIFAPLGHKPCLNFAHGF